MSTNHRCCGSCEHLEYHGFHKGREVNTIYTWCPLKEEHPHPISGCCPQYSKGEPKRME